MKRVGLRDMFAVGPRAVGRYTGTLFAVFIVQSVIAAACMLAVATVLAQAFAHLPLWDDAIDGETLALGWCVRYAHAHLLACGGIVLGSVLLWQLASWFLVGGMLGVLAQRPEGRAETARCFGAAGAITYLKYARLALCALPGWMAAFFAFATCTSLVQTRIELALSIPELALLLLVALGPALAILHVVLTISDYARIELTLRDATHDPGVVRTYLRAVGFVLRRPVTLVHAGTGWLAFAVVTLAYGYFALGRPMYGAEGAVTLFVIRQGVSLLRMALRMGVLAGQVELGRTRALAAPKVELKKPARPD